MGDLTFVCPLDGVRYAHALLDEFGHTHCPRCDVGMPDPRKNGFIHPVHAARSTEEDA